MKNRAEYWDARILDWEASRYDGSFRPSLPPVEWLAGWRSGPTRLRQRLAVELLRPHLAGRDVVEAGCGTGRLVPRFLAAGARSYLGLDHSRVAVESARRALSGEVRAAFEVREAQDLPQNCDLVVSLGVLDWLADDELSAFFRRHAAADFLHTFSERRGGLKQLVHRAGRALDSALRPAAVRPRYMRLSELRALLPRSSRPLYVYRDPGLRYAVFVSTLPLAAGARI
ncbi:MAG: class I SAM-dependent methyltransferase [Elusimicrobia bacterium]|nr:class I SAM-dependent methyltransferase [Elusimicrobiota bacterium]